MVECSTSLVAIIGRDKRVLISILNGRNLRLINVVVGTIDTCLSRAR